LGKKTIYGWKLIGIAPIIAARHSLTPNPVFAILGFRTKNFPFVHARLLLRRHTHRISPDADTGSCENGNKKQKGWIRGDLGSPRFFTFDEMSCQATAGAW